MRVTGRVLRVPKNPGFGSEDASGLSERRMRFAVADGASEGVDVAEWASLLVARYLAAPPALGTSPELVYRWFLDAIAEWNRTRPTADPDDWRFEGVGAAGSAFATFLGLQFLPLDGNRLAWEAVAVGDTCLFHLPSVQARQAGASTSIFPYTRSAAFTSTPDLVPSDLERARRLAPTPAGSPIRMLRGIAITGDLFLLGSDAVSKWLCTLREFRPAIWSRLPYLRTQDLVAMSDEFDDLGEIEHDDLTLAVLRVRDDLRPARPVPRLAPPAGPS